MDAKNSLKQHLVVAALSLGAVALFYFALDMSLPMAFARVSFFLLFIILIIGPLKKLMHKSVKLTVMIAAWSWRGELGIWFTITALTHFILLWLDRPLGQMIKIGGSGYSLANLIGLVALVWAVLLAITSLNKVILFLGLGVWKWVHSFTYVVFYLSVVHVVYFQFFSTHGEVGPDWFGYAMVTMAVVVVALQFMAFLREVFTHRSKLRSE